MEANREASCSFLCRAPLHICGDDDVSGSRADNGGGRFAVKRMLFIYNPYSGKGIVRTHLSYILEEFSKADYEIVVHPTIEPLDATRVTQECGDSFDMIVCSGGDGTLDEVVTGMQTGRFTRPLGYIPAGSTNDYASSLGIPKEMTKAARAIMNGRIFQSDLGRMNDSYFVYVAAFGAFVEVSYDTPQDMKNLLGHAAYVIKGMQSLTSLKAYRLRYESAESKGEGEFLFGMITNSISVGGFKGITGSGVNLDDGLFEVSLFRMPALAVEYPAMINSVLNKTSNRNVIKFKTSRVEFWFEEPASWTRDGEFGGNPRHVVVENIPRAIPIIVSEDTE